MISHNAASRLCDMLDPSKGADLMKKKYLMPGFAVLSGVVGLLLRRWELKTAFEPDTGLPLSGMASTYALMAWSVLVVLVLIALSLREKGAWSYDVAFCAQGDTVYAVAGVLSGFLLLLSAGTELVTYPITYQTILNTTEDGSPIWLPLILPLLRIALCLLGFLCVLLIVRNLYGAKGQGREHLPLLGLCALFCVWLISDYQLRSADPVVQDYIYEVFAISTSLLGLYEIATWSFQTGHMRRTLVLSLLGTYFSLVTLADRHSLAELCRCGFAILFLTAHAALLLGEHPAGEMPPAETEAEPYA